MTCFWDFEINFKSFGKCWDPKRAPESQNNAVIEAKTNPYSTPIVSPLITKFISVFHNIIILHS